MKKKEEDRIPALFIAACFAIALCGTLLAVGWNYGISEVVENLGGPDSNISIFEGMAICIVAGLVKFYK